MMGTTLEISVPGPDRAAALAASETAVRALEEAEARLSTWRGGTELAGLNAAPVGKPYPLSPTLAAELADALACAAETRGAFDPTVAALVRAWDLRGAGRLPTGSERTAALAATGFEKLSVSGGAATKAGPIGVEEGAFGKGAGLRAAIASLHAAGVTAASLNLGGQTAALGEHFVLMAHPRRRGEPVIRLRLDGGSFATSGNSEQRRRVGGVEIGHLLDPRTGRMARDFGAVGVWAADPLRADCLSTALFVMGPAAALAWARAHPEVGVLVLEPTGDRVRARVAGRLEGRVAWRAPSVDLVSSSE